MSFTDPAVLYHIRIFEGIPLDVVTSVFETATFKSYKKDEFLFDEGSFPKHLICIISGKIKVFQLGVDGKEQIVHMIKSGDIMGHRAICAEDSFSCSAVAIDDTKVVLIPKSVFLELMNSNPKLGLRIAQLLANELKDAETKITHMAQDSVKLRLAFTLMELIKNYGFKNDQKTLNINMTREDLSALVGTTRESITRVLHDFDQDNIIELKGRQIIIPSVDPIQRFIKASH